MPFVVNDVLLEYESYFLIPFWWLILHCCYLSLVRNLKIIFPTRFLGAKIADFMTVWFFGNFLAKLTLAAPKSEPRFLFVGAKKCKIILSQHFSVVVAAAVRSDNQNHFLGNDPNVNVTDPVWIDSLPVSRLPVGSARARTRARTWRRLHPGKRSR